MKKVFIILLLFVTGCAGIFSRREVTIESYSQMVKVEIENRCRKNYSLVGVGSVELNFTLFKNGRIKRAAVDDFRSTQNKAVREIVMKSLKEAEPFPKFPKKFKEIELTFNVIIDFKDREYPVTKQIIEKHKRQD